MLLYELEQAPNEKAIILQALKLKRPIPKPMQQAPTLLLGLELYYTCFWDLVADRLNPTSMIPWQAVQWWAESHNLDSFATSKLHYFVRQLDMAFIKHANKKQGGKGQKPAK